MLLAVTIDSSRIHSLFTSPGNRALALLSSLFSKAFQELSRSRYVSVFEAAAGNALWVKNIFLFRVPRYFWPGNEIRPFVWAPPFHNLCVCSLFQSILLLGEGLKNQGSTGVINMRDKPSRGEGLCKLTCINWWITDLLVRRRQKLQTPWVCFGFYTCSCVLYVPLFWKEATSHEERWGWWDEVSASSTVPDSIHGKSLLQHLILACTNVPCSVFLLCFEQSQGWGLTTSLAVCSPSPQDSLWDFFLHRYPHHFTVCFQLKSLSLHGPKPILVISLCGLSYLSVFSIFAGLQEQEE